MKRSVIFFLLFAVACVLCADNYKILKMNVDQIKIGNRICVEGDTFSEDSVIHWNVSKQAIKARNERTMQVRMFTEPEFSSKGSKTIKDYYVKTNRLSTRGTIITLDDLTNEIPDTIYLCDSMIFESPVKIDSLRYFLMKYKVENKQIEKKIDAKGRLVIINKEQFCRSMETDEITISLMYKMKNWNDVECIKDSIKVIFLPWEDD